MKTDEQKSRVLLGEITGVHGIRGDILVRAYTGAPEAIASYGPLTDQSGTRNFSLAVVRVTDKGIVAKINGVTDRTAAEALRGTKLFVTRDRLPEPEAAEYYHADLIGLKAVADDGNELGRIVSVQNFGAGDLLELKPLSDSATEFIPFEDEWVPRIDLGTGTVVINRPRLSDADEPNENEDEPGDGEEI